MKSRFHDNVDVRYFTANGDTLLGRKMDAVAACWRGSTQHLSKETQDAVLLEWRDSRLSLRIPRELMEEINERFGG